MERKDRNRQESAPTTTPPPLTSTRPTVEAVPQPDIQAAVAAALKDQDRARTARRRRAGAVVWPLVSIGAFLLFPTLLVAVLGGLVSVGAVLHALFTRGARPGGVLGGLILAGLVWIARSGGSSLSPSGTTPPRRGPAPEAPPASGDPSPAPEAREFGAWRVARGTDALTDAPWWRVSLDGEGEGRDAGILVVSLDETGPTEVYVVVDRFIGIRPARVWLRFDGGEPEEAGLWSPSTDRLAVFAPEGEAARLVERMATCKTLRVRVETPGGDQFDRRFQVHGLAPSILLAKTGR